MIEKLIRRFRDWLRLKLGVKDLQWSIAALNNRLVAIEGLIQIGVDLNFKTPSWIVVCLRGKNQDIVRFFELPDSEIAHIFELLKELERRWKVKPVMDAPPYIKREYLKF